MFDPTKPVQTRDGRKARIVCTDALGPSSIIALIALSSGHEITAYRKADGKYDGIDCPGDLVNIPVRRSEFQNVWSKQGSATYRYSSLSACQVGMSAASLRNNGNWIGYIEIVFEDNEVVEVLFHKEFPE